MRALGIPPLSQTISRTLPMHERKSKGNKKKVCEDDDDYQPPMDDKLLSSSSEDDNDDLEEVTCMAPGRRSKNVIPSTSVPEFVPERRILVASNQPPQHTRSELPHPEPSSIAQPDQLESPQMIGSSVGSVPLARINVRGATRGKGIERLVRQLGHAIPVPIPSSSGAPEGEHATSLANEIGKEIRSSAPVRNCDTFYRPKAEYEHGLENCFPVCCNCENTYFEFRESDNVFLCLWSETVKLVSSVEGGRSCTAANWPRTSYAGTITLIVTRTSVNLSYNITCGSKENTAAQVEAHAAGTLTLIAWDP
ncbi:uncharacterized protein A4U43_C02F13620 [Asparagus officinalis]|uniref:Uncharacterized protein n=1 Tax=Asparagus officinalis TaxID=4686 RepID=A0A5P1FIW8_ASPOF|nr:uncharacterized protein A4U43_C02F13620 [Asparagus officinalis]